MKIMLYGVIWYSVIFLCHNICFILYFSGQREVKDAYNYTYSRPINTINNNPSVYTNPNQQQYNQFFSYGNYQGSEVIPNQSGIQLAEKQDEAIHQNDYIVSY